MNSFLNKDGSIIVLDLIHAIQKNKDYLSEVDGAIGDGDHGINMNKGFTLCKERMVGKTPNLSESLKILGRVLMTEIGGSMGPLYGTFFNEMSKVCAGVEEIDKGTYFEMLKAAQAGVQSLGDAKLGDKTLLDTLIPATEAFERSLTAGEDFEAALLSMKDAAEKGKESTKDLVAKIGRASRLGERSRGVLDAGATSCNIIIASMADSIIELLKV